MKINALQLVAFVPLLLACTTAKGGESIRIKAINFCIHEYSRLSGIRLSPEADKVFMIHAGDKIELVFHRGELGSPEKPSKSYGAYLSCGVQVSDPMRIYFLGEPMKHSLIDLPDVSWISERSSIAEVRESMYVRTGERFRLVAERPWDPGEFNPGEIGNPGIRE